MNALAAVATAAGMVTIGSGGVYLGRVGSLPGRRRREAREKARREEVERQRKADEADAHRDNVLLELTWAVTGKPATEWAPERRGLLASMIALDERLGSHIEDDRALAAALSRLDERTRALEKR